VHSLLGRCFVLAALAIAAFGSIVGLWAGRSQSLAGLRWTQRAAYGFSAAMTLANVTMLSALLSHDFSVHYVSQVGSRASPTWVTIVSLWSSLEGSILFWGLILSAYVSAFTFTLRDRYREYMPYALGSILVICVFFAFLIAGPANPFLPVSPVPEDGPGPNPLLQNHVLMIVHPPMLYFGYVGMTIPFGIAVAALLRGQLTDGWLKPLRRWTMIPWTFLSIGIVLGGWWAYEVLGWGGYWAWDPVENASFLPWLAATGYLHATVVQERRRILRAWTLALVLAAFLLTILGTFMTRSGVFNSVHSFTQSSIGPTFLVFLGILTIVSLGLLAGRAHLLESEGRVESPVSREAAFVLNNIVFVVFTFTVLLGTVFPLVIEAVKGTKISVGEPYFNSMAIPIGLVLVFLMGVGPALPWGQPRLDVALRRFLLPVGAGIAVVALGLALGLHAPLALFTFGLCGFAGAATLQEIIEPALARARTRGESFGIALARNTAATRRRFGGYVVHLAVIGVVAAIAASQTYRYSVEASLGKGDQFVIGDYTLRYTEPGAEEASHRFSVFANLEVTKGGESLGAIRPRLNYYPTQREPIGTPHVRTFGGTDLYLSLLNFDRDTERVAVKAYVIPGVPWIWWALPVLVLGSAISLWPRRRSRPTVLAAAASTA
jgi:cytochrome c-type biogenesis protein CcmF